MHRAGDGVDEMTIWLVTIGKCLGDVADRGQAPRLRMIGDCSRELRGFPVLDDIAGVAPQRFVAAAQGAGKFIRPVVIEVVGNDFCLSFPKLAQRFGNAGPSSDSVSLPRTTTSKAANHTDPPATETEFRSPHPFPKRCANFGNESKKTASPARGWRGGLRETNLAWLETRRDGGAAGASLRCRAAGRRKWAQEHTCR
jgi:hypothetical protein